MNKYINMSLSDINLPQMVQEMFAICHQYAIMLPKGISMLARSLITIEGTMRVLDPKTNIMQVLSSYEMELLNINWNRKLKSMLQSGGGRGGFHRAADSRETLDGGASKGPAESQFEFTRIRSAAGQFGSNDQPNRRLYFDCLAFAGVQRHLHDEYASKAARHSAAGRFWISDRVWNESVAVREDVVPASEKQTILGGIYEGTYKIGRAHV